MAVPSIRRLTARAVLVPLRRPVIAGIGRFDEWPLVLIDVEVTGGAVGHAYVAPYRASAVNTVMAELRDLSDLVCGRPAAPHDLFEAELHTLNVIGVAGGSAIAVSGSTWRC